MNEVKAAIDALFADRSLDHATRLDNLEAVIRHAAMYADVIRAEFGAEAIAQDVEAVLSA